VDLTVPQKTSSKNHSELGVAVYHLTAGANSIRANLGNGTEVLDRVTNFTTYIPHPNCHKRLLL